MLTHEEIDKWPKNGTGYRTMDSPCYTEIASPQTVDCAFCSRHTNEVMWALKSKETDIIVFICNVCFDAVKMDKSRKILMERRRLRAERERAIERER